MIWGVARLWVETGFGSPGAKQILQAMQADGMSLEESLIQMYRGGFDPFCAAVVDGWRTQGLARGNPNFADRSILMNLYQQELQRFLEQNYGEDVSDFVLPRFNSDKPL
jgi:hypothetical protein